jgi:hypothetical protein
MIEIETYIRKDGEPMIGVHLGGAVHFMTAYEWHSLAARIMRTVVSDKQKEASRENGKKGGRPKKVSKE